MIYVLLMIFEVPRTRVVSVNEMKFYVKKRMYIKNQLIVINLCQNIVDLKFYFPLKLIVL